MSFELFFLENAEIDFQSVAAKKKKCRNRLKRPEKSDSISFSRRSELFADKSVENSNLA